jgi:hypothetical protein
LLEFLNACQNGVIVVIRGKHLQMNTNLISDSKSFVTIEEYVKAMAEFYRESIPVLAIYLELLQHFGLTLKSIGEVGRIKFMKEITQTQLSHEFYNAHLNSMFNHRLAVMTGFKRCKDGSIVSCWFNGVLSEQQGPNCTAAFNSPEMKGLIEEAEEYYGFIIPTKFITEYRGRCKTTIQIILWYIKVMGPLLPFDDEAFDINPEDGLPLSKEEIIKENKALAPIVESVHK